MFCLFNVPIELLLQAVPSRRCFCWWREIACILFWIIIVSAIPVTVIVIIRHRSHDVTYLGYGGHTIELMKVNGFWYDDLTVSEVVEEGDSEHKIQLYLPPCSDIKVHEKSGHYISRKYQHSYPIRLLGTIDYLYLLPGSKVSYNLCLWSNETVSPAQFFFFDDQKHYIDYINGDTDGVNTAIFYYDLAIGTPSKHICSQIIFTANTSAYYFMTGSCDAGVTYQYNVSTQTKLLEFRDYKENKSCAAVTESHSCDVPVGSAFLSKSEDYCLLAHILPHKKHSDLSPTTHINVNAGKREEVMVIPILVIVVGVVGLLAVVVTYFCCCCKKCCCRNHPRNRGYTLINV